MKSRSLMKREKLFRLTPKEYRMEVGQGPDWLIPIYDKDQQALNNILSKESNRDYLAHFTYQNKAVTGHLTKISEGYIWRIFLKHFGNTLKGVVPNAGWHMRMIFDNLVNLLKSYSNNAAVYQMLKKNDNKINSTLWNEIYKSNYHTTWGQLRTYQNKKDDALPFPDKKIFVMDYSISDRQMFQIDKSSLECKFHIFSTKEAKALKLSKDQEWRSFKIYLFPYIRKQLTGRFANPQFVKKDDKFICCLPYQVKHDFHPDFNNILGADLGKVKPFSATVIYKDGRISNEYVCSKRTMKLSQKIKALSKRISLLYTKKDACASLYKDDQPHTLRQQRRNIDLENVKKKRTRVKKEYAWLIANDLIQIALKEHVFLIKMENLSWLLSKGGKWNFNEIQKRVKELAYLNGIAVETISPKYTSEEHPFTKEKGSPSGRNIVFADKTRRDRDNLAGINIACRKKGKKKSKKIHLCHNQTVKLHYQSRKRQNLLAKKSLQTLNFKKSNRVHKIVVLSLKPLQPRLKALRFSVCQGFVNNLSFSLKLSNFTEMTRCCDIS